MLGVAISWFIYMITQLPTFGGNYDPIDIFNGSFSNLIVIYLTVLIIYYRKTNNLILFDKYLSIFITFVVFWGFYQLSLDLFNFWDYSTEWIVICGISTNLLYFVGGLYIWSTHKRMTFLINDVELEVTPKR